MPLHTLRLISVPVSDPDRAKQFYRERLDFTLVRDDPFGQDRRWVQLRPPGGGPDISLVTWFATMPAGSLRGVVLACDDMEQTAAELRARGVVLDDGGRIQDAPSGRWVSVADPNGNRWIIQQDNPTV